MQQAPRQSYSLGELLGSVRRCLEASFTGRYWVRAETSDLRQAGYSGHVYLELIEKGEGGSIRSRARASIWASHYKSLEQRLAQAGLGRLQSGLSVLVLVQLSFHEQYGLSLNILDIDPAYSLGDIARQRLETLNRLRREGVLGDNKALSLPTPLRRLAIVSSATAAGLGDFLSQLEGNKYGLRFYTALFVAQMQGEQTAQSVIAALERIAQYQEAFDAVIIIRGGGAVSELRAFDAYELCYYCTQYPMPIICGIGHERDESLLDLVAHTSLKTPTAVAEYLIHRGLEELSRVEVLEERLRDATARLSLERARGLDQLVLRLPMLGGRALRLARERLEANTMRLGRVARAQLGQYRLAVETRLPLMRYQLRARLSERGAELEQSRERLSRALGRLSEERLRRLELMEQALRLSHPDTILARGFAIVERKDGSILPKGGELKAGEELSLRLSERSVPVVVK